MDRALHPEGVWHGNFFWGGRFVPRVALESLGRGVADRSRRLSAVSCIHVTERDWRRPRRLPRE